MAVREIIRMGHPSLREPAADYPPGKIGSADFNVLIEDMRETLHAYSGIGLAAPQINIGSRIVVIEVENTSSRYGEVERIPFDVYVNPTITTLEEEVAGYWEGCLSVPGMMGYVERPQHIRVDFLDSHGDPGSLDVHGFLATVFQHEFDHLDGILYVDRITDKSRFAFVEEYRQYHADSEDSGS